MNQAELQKKYDQKIEEYNGLLQDLVNKKRQIKSYKKKFKKIQEKMEFNKIQSKVKDEKIKSLEIELIESKQLVITALYSEQEKGSNSNEEFIKKLQKQIKELQCKNGIEQKHEKDQEQYCVKNILSESKRQEEINRMLDALNENGKFNPYVNKIKQYIDKFQKEMESLLQNEKDLKLQIKYQPTESLGSSIFDIESSNSQSCSNLQEVKPQQLQQLNEELSILCKGLEEREEENENIKKFLEEKLEEYKLSNEELEQSNRELRSENLDLIQNCDELDQELQEHKDDNILLAQQCLEQDENDKLCEELETKCEELKLKHSDECSNFETCIQQHKDKYELLNKEYNELREKNNLHEDNKKSQERYKKQFKNKVNKLKQKQKELEQSNHQYNKQFNQIQLYYQQQQLQVDKLKKQHEELQEQNHCHINKHVELEKSIEEYQKKNQKLLKKSLQQKEMIEQLKKQNKKSIDEYQKEILRFQNKCKQLQLECQKHSNKSRKFEEMIKQYKKLNDKSIKEYQKKNKHLQNECKQLEQQNHEHKENSFEFEDMIEQYFKKQNEKSNQDLQKNNDFFKFEEKQPVQKNIVEYENKSIQFEEMIKSYENSVEEYQMKNKHFKNQLDQLEQKNQEYIRESLGFEEFIEQYKKQQDNLAKKCKKPKEKKIFNIKSDWIFKIKNIVKQHDNTSIKQTIHQKKSPRRHSKSSNKQRPIKFNNYNQTTLPKRTHSRSPIQNRFSHRKINLQTLKLKNGSFSMSNSMDIKKYQTRQNLLKKKIYQLNQMKHKSISFQQQFTKLYSSGYYKTPDKKRTKLMNSLRSKNPKKVLQF